MYRNKGRFIFFSVLVVIAGFLLGFNENKGNMTNISTVSAEWLENESVDEMFKESDLVVIGTVSKPIDTIQPFKEKYKDIIYSVYDLETKIVLKGNPKVKDISLINYGGTTEEEEKIVWENIMELDNGNLYLFFLDHLTESDFKDERYGKFRPINGPSGTYLVSSEDSDTLKELVTKESLSIDDLKINQLKLSVEDSVLEVQREVINGGFNKLESLMNISENQN